MSNALQDFYKATISQDWSIGTGTFYVSTKPTTSPGRLVISPSSDTLREIIEYTSTGTDANGDYIIVSTRGVGSTTEQTHTVGEKVRMNITAEDWEDMRDDIDSIVAAGAPNASTTERGIVEIATDAEVLAGTDTGSTGAKLVATPGQIKTNYEKIVPIVRTYLNAVSPATWTKPSGLKYIEVEVQAGGGGSGSAENGFGEVSVGGGGGGGGYSKKIISVSSLGSTEIVTIGNGGAAGTVSGSGTGSTGGTSSFGTHLSATGGTGGQTNGSGGSGGNGSNGDINLVGSNGLKGGRETDVDSYGGLGGSSHLGGSGGLYGGGGNGPYNDISKADVNGNAGSAGIVIVKEFY